MAEKMLTAVATWGFKRVVVLALLTASSGFSTTIAYDVAVRITGNQAYFGSLGVDFQVLDPIEVTEIGVFSNNAFGHLTAAPRTDLNAAIFSIASFTATSGAIIAPTEVSFLTSTTYLVTDDWLFQNITPFELLPGFYTIVAQGYNALEKNGNNGVAPLPLSLENTGGGLITFGGVSRFGSVPRSLPNPVTFPKTRDTGPSNRYYAGDFQFSAVPSAVPEPASLTLFGGGLAGLCLMLRRRRKV